MLETHGGVDVLVNNAGRSIRRSVALSYDRFHDYERTMQLNYFGALRLILAFLPGMRERGPATSSTSARSACRRNTPRFSAYIASKAALDTLLDAASAPEMRRRQRQVHDGLHAARAHADDRADDIYKAFPTLTPERGRARCSPTR